MKTLYITLGILVALAFAAWLAHPAYRGWKQQRCIEQARHFLDKEDYRNAALSVRQALRLNPTSVEATRIMADLVEKTHAPGLVSWRQRLVELEPANPTNRLRLAEVALMAGGVALAAQSLDAIAPTDRSSVPYQELAAMVAVATNNLAAADTHYAAAIRLSPTNQLLQLNRAVLLMQSTNQATAEAARQTVDQLAQIPALRRNALKNLITISLRRHDHDRALEVSRRLIASPEATFDDRLQHLALLSQFNQADFAQALAETKKRAEADPRDVQTLVAWLLGRKQSDEASHWLESLPPDLKAKERVVMARADCAMARSQWAELVALLKDARWPEMDFVRRAMLARAYRELKQPSAADAEWRASVLDAGDRPTAVAALARMAGTWGWKQEQEDLLWNIVRRFPRETWAIEMLRRLYTTRLDTRGLHRVYSVIVGFNPQNLAAKNNLAATSLLLNQQVSRADEMARDLYQTQPTNEVFASTYAWSLHLRGKSAEALQVMEKLKPRQLEEPAIALYYGSLLATNHLPAKAKLYLDIATNASILPEEKAILEAAVASLK